MKKITLLLLTACMFLTACSCNTEERNNTQAVNKYEDYNSMYSDNIPDGKYLVLDKNEMRINALITVSFVLENKEGTRYYIAYDSNPVGKDDFYNSLLKIIPGDTVIFSADTQLLKLQEETKWKS